MILATAGHIDHGKTALVRALTGVDADRLPEEKRRGLTIDLGFAYTTLPDGTELGFVDVPGHERFLPNMLAGVLSIDRVLLIVAADDGPRPQTLEHLDILELIGVAEVTGVVTKIDRVDAARREKVIGEVSALLDVAGYANSPIFSVSSRTGEGIPALAAHLSERAALADRARAGKWPDGQFRLPIDRVFSLPGIGMVATGTVAAGSIAPTDHLTLSPRGIEVRVRGVHAHNRPVERAAAGDRCALNIVGSFPDGAEPGRGDWLVAADLHAPTARIDVVLRVSRAASVPVRSGLPVHVHLGTEDQVGRAVILGRNELRASDEGFVQLELERPIGALWGDRVVLRDHGALHTLAGGRVVDPFPPRRGRARPERLAVLVASQESDAGSALERLLGLSGSVGLAPFALARNLTGE
jgi:selenocysteine-specific elongation factor